MRSTSACSAGLNSGGTRVAEGCSILTNGNLVSASTGCAMSGDSRRNERVPDTNGVTAWASASSEGRIRLANLRSRISMAAPPTFIASRNKINNSSCARCSIWSCFLCACYSMWNTLYICRMENVPNDSLVRRKLRKLLILFGFVFPCSLPCWNILNGASRDDCRRALDFVRLPSPKLARWLRRRSRCRLWRSPSWRNAGKAGYRCACSARASRCVTRMPVSIR
ncbi:hypothetical protein LMG18096_03360 [Ralstonia holmesii]|uniref:Uncharacterized protein n=1 Tax=Ralstonia holmesii TaxID=3058602 RepID=A0ABC8QI45_9RALS|nr:hypothetical protein LMG18096_03360 [Ralstonia sp. LMG 32967]CAJ0806112.1 hypothetical protein LMG18093_00129 [Ralstonia sp. LMG 32967]